MKESLLSTTQEGGDTKSGSSIYSDIHDIHTLLDMLPDISNEKIKMEVTGLTQKILALQGLIMSKINEIEEKKEKL